METDALPVRLPGAQADTLMWAHPHEVEQAALDQLRNISRLPWVHGLRVMPDVHLGKGATVGSVVAMRNAVSPAAVGVDIGCGMQAVRTSLTTADLPDDLHALRLAVEAAIPVGFACARRDARRTPPRARPRPVRRLGPVLGRVRRAARRRAGPRDAGRSSRWARSAAATTSSS